MPDGREHGLIFASPFTAYSEALLFELAVDLSRNGSSLRFSAYLRSGYSELTAALRYAERLHRLRSVATLRKGLTLYLSLVVKGLPLAVSACSRCVSSDSAIAVVRFDGLQRGYKHKYKKRSKLHTLRTSAIPRASVHAHVVTDSAVAKALGSVFNTSSNLPAGSSKTITTVTGMRGYVMAVSTLLGIVSVNGKEKTFAGQHQHGMTASTAGKGWCPTFDGGVRPALEAFLRRFFRCKLVAGSFCTQSLAANLDLYRRVPEPLKTRIQDQVRARPAEMEAPPNTAVVEAKDAERRAAAAAEAPSAAATIPASDCAVGEGPVDVAACRAHPLSAGGPVVSGNGDAGVGGNLSEESEIEETEEELSSADDRVSVDGYSLAAPPPYWDAFASLVGFAELFTEPALADTGGER